MSRIIRITPTFLAEVATAEIDHLGSEQVILDFFVYRQSAPMRQGYGAKDARLRGNLADIWHFHVLHGTLLLFYRISNTSLDALCLRNHSYVESSTRQKALRKSLDAYQTGAFITFDLEAARQAAAPQVPGMPQAPQMADEDLESLQAAIYTLIADRADREVVAEAASGSFNNLRSCLVLLAEHDLEPEGFWEAIVAAFGGELAFRTWLTTALRHTSP